MTAPATNRRRHRLPPVSTARGQFLRPAPLLKDSKDWFESDFDWDNNVAVVDMFCGAGGLSLGFDSVPGMSVVAAFEQDEVAAATHAANMRSAILTGDVRDIDSFSVVLKEQGVRRVDVLTGGPPCAGFSRLGKGALRRLALQNGRGVDLGDSRNFLFREFIRAVRELQPDVVVMENVPEMSYCESVITEIIELLEDLDYHTSPATILRADDYGVPQRRRRLFIVASRSGQGVRWPRRHGTVVTLREAIADLPPIGCAHLNEEVERSAPEPSNSYIRKMRAGLRGRDRLLVRDHVTRAHRSDDLKAFALMSEGDRYAAVPKRLRRYREDIFEDKYHRMIWDEPAWTVTAHLAKDGYKYIHPEQHRTISVREAARIQSFPDCYRFAGSRTHRFMHVGNAVPPLLARAVATAILPLVRSDDEAGDD